VDGNDIFAIYNAVAEARRLIVAEKRPAVIEAISYRIGDHSTSDFSQRYRDEKEMQKWKELLSKFKSPIHRLEQYLLRKGLVKEEDSKQYRQEALNQVREALKTANEDKKPAIHELFEDVYEGRMEHLERQKQELKDHLKIYGDKYDLASYRDGERFPTS
jgi:2-oxoisovalerate dehydrogenase E1 component alpha subunit